MRGHAADHAQGRARPPDQALADAQLRLSHDVQRPALEPVVVLVDRAGEGVLDRHERAVGLALDHRVEELVEGGPRQHLDARPEGARAAWWLNAPRSPWIATFSALSVVIAPSPKPKGPSRFVRERAFVADVSGLRLCRPEARSVGAGKLPGRPRRQSTGVIMPIGRTTSNGGDCGRRDSNPHALTGTRS